MTLKIKAEFIKEVEVGRLVSNAIELVCIEKNVTKSGAFQHLKSLYENGGDLTPFGGEDDELYEKIEELLDFESTILDFEYNDIECNFECFIK